MEPLHLTDDIWSKNMATCARASSQQKLSDAALWCYPLISY